MKQRWSMVFVLLASCASPKTVETPTTEPTAPAATQAQSATPSATVVYHQFEGEPRAYVPLEAAPCQRDEQAQVLFQPRAVWWFDADAGAWTAVGDVAGEVRISCNAMIAVEDVLGQNLELGTFAILANVDGSPERGVFYNGEVVCNDVNLGRPPDGQIALCIGGADSAEARFVPDPGALSE